VPRKLSNIFNNEPIFEGGDFFEMVEHYLERLRDVKKESAIKSILKQ
jgi:hypothetical protein